MSTDVPGPAGAGRGLPQQVYRRPLGWLPGQMLVSARLELAPDTSPDLQGLRRVVRDLLGPDSIPAEPPEPRQPPLVLPTFDAEHPRQHLLFAPITLASPEPRAMKEAINTLNGDDARKRLEAAGFGQAAATPNWFSAAQDCSGGSPGSYPAPVVPFGRRIRYRPRGALDLVDLARSAHWAHTGSGPERMHLAVLDTCPTPDDLARARNAFADNAHLHDLLDHLLDPIGGLTQAELELARHSALKDLDDGGFRPIEPPEPFDIRDHGLFVAGVALATAPWLRIRLIRVLNNFGVGSLQSLLIAIIALVLGKQRDEPLVINLSLGMLPALEQLGSIWFGLPIAGLPGSPEDPSLQFVGRGQQVARVDLQRMVDHNAPEVATAVQRLHAPVQDLMGVLLAHNCLVVAAAGNDSVFRGVERHPRWDPRIPAAYDEVLGVAAETVAPSGPAPYSNRGEFHGAAVRDAVATFGGGLADDGVSPRAGMISVYTADAFPPGLPPAGAVPNETGWAEWSGTSFATPLMAAMAANFWATYPATASATLAALNTAARFGGPSVPELGVPPVPVRLTWLP